MFIFIIVYVSHGLPWWLSGKESASQCRRHGFNPWVRKIPWRMDRLLTLVFLGFLGDSEHKEPTFSAGNLDLISGWGRTSAGGHGNPL